MSETSVHDITDIKITLNKIVRNSTHVIFTMGLLLLAALPFLTGYFENSLLLATLILTALAVLYILHRQRKQLVKKLELFLN